MSYDEHLISMAGGDGETVDQIAAIEAVANAISECSGMRFDGFWSRIEDLEPEDRDYALMEARAAIEAAAPHLKAEAWREGYRAGVADERTSSTVQMEGYGPNRVNPYRAVTVRGGE